MARTRPAEICALGAIGATPPDTALGDLRFRSLLSEAEWARLPRAIQKRFSKRLAGGRTVIYVGRVTEMAMTRTGMLLAQLARVIGGPLPTSCDVDLASIVTVTEDMRTGGQIWTRLYARRHGFPQVIHSLKRFEGPAGLEEYVGRGVGMTLTVRATDNALIFKSQRYFVEVGRLRLYLPRWLDPGALTVTHAEIDPAHFTFMLDIVHPWFGPLIHQCAVFEEAGQSSPGA